MAELLRCSENRKPNERMERKVAAKNTNVYLETVEEAENKGNKLKEVRNAQMEAYRNGNTRKGYWAIAGSGILTHTITNERLARRGYYDISEAYKSMHSI